MRDGDASCCPCVRGSLPGYSYIQLYVLWPWLTPIDEIFLNIFENVKGLFWTKICLGFQNRSQIWQGVFRSMFFFDGEHVDISHSSNSDKIRTSHQPGPRMAVEAGLQLLHHTFGVIGLLRSKFENIQIPNFKFQISNFKSLILPHPQICYTQVYSIVQLSYTKFSSLY